MSKAVEAHYTRGNLLEAIREALTAAGKDLSRLTIEDLVLVDEFHLRGREATEELAHQAALTADAHVLDVGSGVGGPARWLASRVGCRVTGIDLTEEFCQAATALTQWVGLSERVQFKQGDALHMPFADASFDAAWTQHVAMNIADKARLYSEVARVVKPGGKFAIYDLLQGPGGEVLYPVPWAPDASLSFLARPEEMRALLGGAGFKIVHERDTTEIGLAWFRRALERVKAGQRPPLALHSLGGARLPEMLRNVERNLAEDRIRAFEFVSVRER